MCLHLFLSLTSSLAVPMTLCLGLLGSGLAGSEREVVVNMLNSLSRNQPLPQITPRCGCVDPLPGRLPFQGYESACSGRHYCLRGMDYSVSGPPCTERRLRPLCTELPTVRFAGPRRRRAPPPNKPRPQSPALPRPASPAGLASRATSSSAWRLCQTPLRLQPARSPYWAPPCPFLGPHGLSRLLRLET